MSTPVQEMLIFILWMSNFAQIGHLCKWHAMYHDLVETRCYAKPSHRRKKKKNKKYATSLASLREREKKKENTEEEERLRLCFMYKYIARHYGVDGGCTVCAQTKADNARWKRINSSASGLLKQEFGGDQPASGRSHVAASLCSKVTVVARRLLISAPEVSHPVLLLLLLLRPVLLLRRFGMRQLHSFRRSPKKPCSHGSALPHPCNFHHQ